LTTDIQLIQSILTGKNEISDFIINEKTSQFFFYCKGQGVYVIDRKKRVKLIPDSSKIMDLILNKIGIEDLSKIEKENYNL
jgi:hypothetical protein